MLIMNLEKEREMVRVMKVWWIRLLYSVNSLVEKDFRYATQSRPISGLGRDSTDSHFYRI